MLNTAVVVQWLVYGLAMLQERNEAVTRVQTIAYFVMLTESPGRRMFYFLENFV